MLSKFFQTIILVGVVQGFVVSSLLFFVKKNKLQNRLLAALILVITLAGFNLYGNFANWFGSPLLRFITDIVPLVMPMAIGPLMYFYVQAVLSPGFRMGKKQKRHFIPLVIDLVPAFVPILYLVLLLTKLIARNPAPWGNFIDTYNVYADIPRWLSVTIYVWFSSKYISKYISKRQGTLNGQSLHVKWLQQFVRVFMIFQAVWLIYLIPYIIPRYSDWLLSTFDWYPLYIPMAVMVYWLGIKGYMITQQQALTDKKIAAGSSSLSPELVQQVMTALEHSMKTDNMYLNPALSLTLLSEHTGFNQKAISTVLNQYMQTSFNDYVNGYRVTAFKEKAAQPDSGRLTIAGIAFECGFSSQATFQRVFKLSTGLTPKAFLSKKEETAENNAQIMM